VWTAPLPGTSHFMGFQRVSWKPHSRPHGQEGAENARVIRGVSYRGWIRESRDSRNPIRRDFANPRTKRIRGFGESWHCEDWSLDAQVF
jgi:hypothetical protein